MANATNNPNAQYDVGPNIAGSVLQPAKAYVPNTVTSAFSNPNSNVTLTSLISGAPGFSTFHIVILNFGADLPITVELSSYELTLFLPTDTNGVSTLTAAALVNLFNTTPTSDGLPLQASLSIAEGEDGSGLVDLPILTPYDMYVYANQLDYVDSRTGAQADGVVGGSNLRIGFNAAGVPRNNPGPNAAGALRRP